MGALDDLLARTKGQRVYVEANFFIYFLNQQEPYFGVVAPLFRAADAGHFQAVCGDAVVSEVMVHPYKLHSPSEVARAKKLFSREDFLQVLRHNPESFDLAAQLRASSNLRMIDALHCATAIHFGCRYLLTNDRAMTSTESIEVIGVSSLLKNAP